MHALTNMLLKFRLNKFNNEAVQSIKIWESYEIHPSKPRKLVEFNTWTTPNLHDLSRPLGFLFEQKDKWIRRKDLEVRLLQIIYFSHKNYKEILQSQKLQIFLYISKLQGMNFDILSLPASPYIETMNLIDGKKGEYEMTGWYSDVWSELPVSRLYGKS